MRGWAREKEGGEHLFSEGTELGERWDVQAAVDRKNLTAGERGLPGLGCCKSRGASAHPRDGKGCSRVGEISAQSHYTGGGCSFPAIITH